MKSGIQVLFIVLIWPFFSVAKDSGLAESQLQLCADSQLVEVREKLELSVHPDKERFTGFFDTPSLDLYNRQFFVRVRKSKSKVQITLKKNQPTDIQWNDPRLDCETDVHGTYTKRSCSYDLELSQKGFNKLKADPTLWIKLTDSEAQEIFFELSEGFDFSQLKFLGEVPNSKWELSLEGESVDFDVWFMPPQNKPMMEISLRSKAAKSAEAFTWLSQVAAQRGLQICEDSPGRTRTLLFYLTGKPLPWF